ncbi:MAG: PKD domain-containing protein [Bacteroidia bacterium]
MKRLLYLIPFLFLLLTGSVHAQCPTSPGTISTSNATLCSGSSPGTIDANAASGGNGALFYVWQQSINSGTTWTAASGTNNLEDYAAPTLTATTWYRRMTIDFGGCSNTFTSEVQFTVTSSTSITADPSDESVCSGDNASFSVTASGSGLGYQWQEDDGGGFTNLSNGGIYTNVNTSTLNISGATTGENGNDYRCVVSSTACPDEISQDATLTVLAAPLVTSSPSNSTVCVNDDPTFAVAASGDALTYQWQVNSGGGYTNLSNGGVYSNIDAATMNITDATAAMDGFEYRCEVDNANCTAVQSSGATLTVQESPNITTDPSDVTVCVDDDPTFTVVASGDALTYQWQVNTGTGFTNLSNGGVYSNIDAATMNITDATSAMNGYLYRCEVDNASCTADQSASATLTVHVAPSVTSAPSNSTVCEDDNASFTVTASGTSLEYQWQQDNGGGFSNLTNGVNVSGATSASLTLSTVSSAMSGNDYRVVISNTGCGSITSAQASLTVDNKPSITSNPSNSTVCVDDDPTFSVTATGSSITYQWQVNTGTGFSNLSNAGVYSNVDQATMTITDATAAMDGFEYRCEVDNANCAAVQSSLATLTVHVAPSVTTAPSNSTTCEDENATFTVVAAGSPLGYQWQQNSGGGFTNLSDGGSVSGATSASLTLSTVGTGMDGYDYRVVISNSGCGSVTSAQANLDVVAKPTITANPANSTDCVGDNLSYSVTATGDALTYQWQVNTGSGFSNLSNGGVYSNVDAATLNITSVTAAMDAYTFRCEVDNANCTAVQSSAATQTVQTSPSITGQPSNATVCVDDDPTFSVTATGSSLTYQWQVNTGGGFANLSNGGVYSNIDAATMTITDATATMDGYLYRCEVGGACTPNVQSNSATLNVQVAASITSNPSGTTVCVDDDPTFSVTATGDALSFQWQVNTGSGFTNLANGGVYSNIDASTMNITDVTAAMNGYQYRCEVDNSACNAATSSTATLTVRTPPTISAHPSDATNCESDNVGFVVTASGTSISYQWQEDRGSGYSNLSDGGVYANTDKAIVVLTNVTTSMNGYKYRCFITGTCSPSATSNEATLTVNGSPSITTNPSNATACVDDDPTFTVVASGGALTYQWQEDQGSGFSNLANGGVYSNIDAATMTITDATVGMDGYSYRCVVDNTTCTSVTSNAATLSVEIAPSITSNPSNSTVCVDGDPTFSITATGDGIAFQWQENSGSGFSNLANAGVYSNVNTASLSITDATATMDGYEYRCFVSGNCTPSATSSSATLSVEEAPVVTSNPSSTTVCVDDDPTFSVVATGDGLTYQWQEDQGSGFSNLSNGGVYSNVTSSTLSITDAPVTMSGFSYRCVISGNCTPDATSGSATLTVQEAPVFTLNPSNASYCAGSNVSLSVTATGTSVSLQWQEDQGSGFANLSNNATYGGVTTSNLTITAAAAGLNGYDYRVVASNTGCGSVNSSAATISSTAAPSITSNPSSATICAGDNQNFSVTATGTGLTYQWQEDQGSGFSNLANGGVYSNVDAATMTITNATAAMSSYDYRVLVSSSSCPSATSSSAALTVNSAPSISSQPSSASFCAGDNVTVSVTAGGAGLTFQWQEDQGSGYSNLSNGGVYSGVSSNSLSISSITTGFNSYKYRVVISGTCTPSITSNEATVTVISQVAISANPSTQNVCVDDDPTFSVTANGGTITYQWQEDQGGGFSNLANGGVYSNVDAATMTITDASTGLDGYDYRCYVTSTCGSPVTSSVATLNVDVAPIVTANPGDLTRCATDAATFSVTAGIGTNLAYQWQEDKGSGFANISNGGIYSGATGTSLSISAVTSAMSGYDYRCVVSNNGCGSVNSGTATLTVNAAPSITSNSGSVDECVGDNASFTITATGASITYQWQENQGSGYTAVTNGGAYSGATTNSLTVSSVTKAMDGYIYRCVVSGTCNPTATSSNSTLSVFNQPNVTTDPSDVSICASSNTTFSVVASGDALTYQWQEDQGSGYANLSAGGVYSGVDGTTLTLTGAGSAMDGYKYRCVVDNTSCAEDISGEATLTVQTAPSVTVDPSDETICDNSNASFSVTATGSSLVYQWQEDQGSGFANITNGGIYTGATSTTLNLTGVGTGLNGYDYRCVVDNSQCTEAISASALLTVQTAPSIVTNPDDSTICESNNATFTIVASGSSITYQWQEDQGSGFSNLSAGGVYSNVDQPTLTITAAAATMTGYNYRCVVDNSECTEVNSTQATLTVQSEPTVTVNPSDDTICETNNSTFSVTATGTSITYQWQEDQGSGFVDLSDGGVYSNVTTSAMTITAATTAMDGYNYRVVVSNSRCADDISASAELTVQTAPTVTTQPIDSTICETNNATFTIAASGSSLTYQWQEDQGSGFSDLSNGGVYSNVDQTTLTITGATTGMDGYEYRVVISNAQCSGLNSNSAELIVQTSPSVTADPSDVTTCEGSNTSFSVTATGTALTFQWQEDQGSGFVDISNGGIYSGATTSTLGLTGVTSGNSGYNYRCVVDNSRCSPVNTADATLTIQISPSVTADPVNDTICENTSTGFAVTATGSALTYQWQEDNGTGFSNLSDGGIYSGTSTDKMSISTAGSGMNGYDYRCVVDNSTCTEDISASAKLKVQETPAVTTNPSNATVCNGSNTSFTVVGSGSDLTYQWQVDAGSGFSDISNAGVYSGATTATLSITGAVTSMNGFDYRCVVDNQTCSPATSSSANLVINELPSVTSSPSSVTVCINDDPTFSVSATGTGLVYQWQVDAGSGFTNITNGGIYSGATTTTLQITNITASEDGYDYRCEVSGTCTPPANSSSATVTVQTPASVTVDPSDAAVCAGSNTTFGVTATGTSLTFQWQVDAGTGFSNITNGGIYSGANSTTLTITGVTASLDGFDYRVEVDNSTCVSTLSGSGELSILALPSVTSNPTANTICEGGSTTFNVTATGAGLTYQWQVDAGSGFADISNGGIYSGATTNSLGLSSVPASNDGNDYRCVVSGTCTPAAFSSSASLRVDSAPSISVQPRDTSLCESFNTFFAVTASGTSIGYTWQIWNGTAFADLTNGGKYSSVDKSTLVITDLVMSLDSTYYRVIVSGPNCPDAISDTVMLDVKEESTKPHPFATIYSYCDGGSTQLSADFGTEGDNSTIEWYTGPNGTGTNFGSGKGPITVSPSDTTTYYLRREGECNTTDDTTITINVRPKPTADFTAFETCEGQATAVFDSSVVSNDSIVKYEWDMGDASSSNLKNVSHTYSSAGDYDIQLVVTTNGNCTDTITKTTTIHEQPTADFSVASVCLNDESAFKDNSSINGTATLSRSWDFGDGAGTSSLVNPEYQYLSTGGYTIELKVTSSDGCIDSISKSTTIYMLPDADFDFDNACLGDDVAFTNKSKIGSGTLTYEWDFEDGNTSTSTSPTNTYSTAGTYDVELVATSNFGCTDTLVQQVETYSLPTADYTFVSACEGEFVSFSDNSSNPTGSNLTYDWDFDNGSSSNNSSPQVRYTSSGSYDVVLTVESAEGCIDDVTKSVDVFGAPTVTFSANRVCDGFATTFTNASSGADASGLSYIWRFGDGDTSLRVAPSHVYSAAGTYNTTLVATSGNGCIDSTVIPVTVWTNPVANFRTSNVCEVDSAEFFNLSSIASGSFSSLWSFGDNTTATRRSPKHLYTGDGTYSTKLIVTSTNGCQDSISQSISIYPMPEPDFTFNNQCDGDEVDFVNQTIVTTGTQYVWAFGDGFGSTTQNPGHTYLNSGTYNVTLTATTANGCQETTTPQTVTIHPRVDLSFNSANVCDNDSVTFVNTSFLSGGTATYAWNFGDGNGVIGQNNAKHLYDTFGVYGVTLYGRTDQNCIDSVKAQVEVYAQPIAQYAVASDCEGVFSDFGNTTIIADGVGITYIWDFSDGFSSNLPSPKHQYSTFGTYNTELVAVTNDGCIDTANRTHNVWPLPEADFRTFGSTTNEVSELCIYETANFTDVSTIAAGNIVNWTWNFGDATSQSGLRNVQKNYILPGVYEVELVAESDSGCTDIATQKIEMLPKPDVDFTFRDTCEGFGVEFANQSTVAKGQMSFTWDFGDNNKSTLREPTHTYLAAGNYDVTLIGISTDGCLDTAGPKNIIIHEIPDATISSNIGVFEFCEGDSAVLSVPLVAGYTYAWSNGDTGNETVVRSGGVIEVTITSTFGCTNSSQELITVWTRPTADAGPDVIISKGYSTELVGSGGLFFTWTPGATLDDSLKQNPIATPLVDETYQLVVEDANGCLDTASVNVTVEEDYRLEPSEIFTPNGDGINDVWVIENITTYPDCEVIITNRWQQIVYQQDNYDNTWGGEGTVAGGQLPTGAYNYLIKCGNGRIYTGTVNILR